MRERLGGSELIELLERVEVAERGRIAEGAVLLAEPLAIRARRFRVVFVCGLQEGEFPRAAAPEPFLSDERRRELAASQRPAAAAARGRARARALPVLRGRLARDRAVSC